ncbi:MAG: response regulator, partial [Pseudomonadota bacterium]
MVSPIVIADDHPLMRGALRQAVIKVAPELDVEDVETLGAARETIARGGASLLLLDLHMDDSDGFAGLISLRQDYPAIPIIVVSASDDDWVVRRAVQFGASGFMSKSSSMAEMAEAFEAVLEGDLAFPEIDEDTYATADEDEAVRQIGTLTPAQLRVLMG